MFKTKKKKAQGAEGAVKFEKNEASKVIEVSYEGYLTEDKLFAIVDFLSGGRAKRQATIGSCAHKFDIVVETEGGKVAFEYDGHHHYLEIRNCVQDRQIDEYCSIWRIKLHRIPYWLQANNDTSFFFADLVPEGWTLKFNTDFPHGFVTTRYFPARFCGAGIERFDFELKSLPEDLSASVRASLAAHVAKGKATSLIIPPGCEHFLK